jgi:hypothetical protein
MQILGGIKLGITKLRHDMNSKESEIGILTAVVERLENRRLPKLMAMKKKVDNGIPLEDDELHFLKKTVKDSNKIMDLVDKYPEYQEIATKAIEIYKEIAHKALQIEKGARRLPLYCSSLRAS